MQKCFKLLKCKTHKWRKNMYFEYYIMGIILLPGLIFAIYAQSKVTRTYREYRSIHAKSGVKASDFVRSLLSSSGMVDITVRQISGQLTDHFNPANKEICLSEDVYNSSSISALGVACHEFGHALQKKDKYVPYQIRRVLIPITNFVSNLLWPLVILGLIFNFAVEGGGLLGEIFLWSGIAVFGLAVLVNLATLPVEFDASKRALKILSSTGTLDEEELDETKEVLNAAALTYVAALLVSILNLLRFILVVTRASKRD